MQTEHLEGMNDDDAITQGQVSPQIGQFYHVYNRGNNRQNVFFERENYLYFLRLIRQAFSNHEIDVMAYCLMPNHYHLLVYPRSEHLSQHLNPVKANLVAQPEEWEFNPSSFSHFPVSSNRDRNS
jgi:REP element-mobilizing transposase RayT